MNILFFTYHGFDPVSGISKKMLAQVKGLRQNGHTVHVCSYGVAADGSRCRYVDGEVIANYGRGALAAVRQRFGLGCVCRYCKAHGVELVYVRHFMNASPTSVRLFSRLRRAGVKSVMEIPTYPYDRELAFFSLSMRLRLRLDQLFRRALARQMEAVVTFSDEERIFGQRTIRISNGVDIDAIPLAASGLSSAATLHLIGVAEVHLWHGYDRLLRGLGEYYRSGHCPRHVVFHIVGGVAPSEMEGTGRVQGFRPIIEEYGLQDRVVFHGQLSGPRLDAVFAQCRFAIGSLARHRTGITVIKTLKNREYASRGLPFIYSEQDSDFDSQPYVLKAPADESPIDIRSIVSFMDTFTMAPADIRRTVEHLAWKVQMQKVVDAVGNSEQPESVESV